MSNRISLGTPPVALNEAIRQSNTSCLAVFNRMAREYPVLFRLIYCCGLRNNEACSLKICDVDLENGLITLYRTKGNKD